MTSFEPRTRRAGPPTAPSRPALREQLPALAALVAALASSVVLTLAGCASSAGIVTTALPFSLDQLGVAGAAVRHLLPLVDAVPDAAGAVWSTRAQRLPAGVGVSGAH